LEGFNDLVKGTEAWRQYSGDWEVHKFGGASLNDAGLYKTCGDTLIKECLRDLGPEGDANIPTAAIVSAAGGMTDALVDVVTTSVTDLTLAAEKITTAADRQINITLELVKDKPKYTDPVVANIKKDAAGVSAMLEAVKLMGGVPPQMLELVAGLGEVWSAQTLAAYLASEGHRCEWMDARDILLVPETDGGLGEKGQAIETIVPLWDQSSKRLQDWWVRKFPEETKKAPLVIVTGFVCSTPTGRRTTLKRSGSDYSATIFAKLFGACSVTMWKNVNGVYTADPRRVPDAFPIPKLTFDEAMELAYFGGQVLHPSAMLPCIDCRIPVLVRNIFNPSHPGSKVYGRGDEALRWEDQDDGDDVSETPVKALTSIEKVALVTLSGASFLGTHGVAKRMMEALASASVNVILASQGSSEHSITVAVDEAQVDAAASMLEKTFNLETAQDSEIRVKTKRGCSIVAIIGEGMKNTPNISGRFFSALGRAKCNVVAIAQGSSERNISAVVMRDDLSRALRATHAGFTLSQVTISVGIIGAGEVATQLMMQLANFQSSLQAKTHKIPALAELKTLNIEVRGICDLDKMIFAEHGIDMSNLPMEGQGINLHCPLDKLFSSMAKDKPSNFHFKDTNMEAFENFIDCKRIPHTVLIDCTATEEITNLYQGWLKRGIHVISPNKRMGSGPFKRYRQCMELARNSNAFWYYDSTVGAQLPVMSMLHDILQTGDRVTMVQGSLSGTMGYCLLQMEKNPELKFSEAICMARDAELLEPDPVEDLSGRDAARKALIIARELGMEHEMEDLKVESLLPSDITTAATPETWDAMIKALQAGTDEKIATLMKEAKAKGEYIRYVSEVDVENGSVSVGFRSVDEDHALASLRKGETVVSLVSMRYTTYTPLVIRGRGAGSLVTAGGVFASLLRLSRRLGDS